MTDPFFTAFREIMDGMIDEARVVEEHHITVARLVQEAKRRGLTMDSEKAWKLIRKRVAAGLLVSDGKRVDPNTNKKVNVWLPAVGK